MDVNQTIDINCDLGEGVTNDAELMPYISSCNIACGGHFGDKETIRAAIRLAKKHKVKIGAHPSYPDRKNFGRKSMEISQSELKASLKEQISNFLEVCEAEGISANHIKLHGALYNDTAKNEKLVNIILTVYDEMKLNLPFYAAPNSILTQQFPNTKTEAFIDRRYQHDLNLVPRSHAQALILDPSEAWEQLKRMHLHQELISLDGTVLPINAETYCIHGDTENALETLHFIHRELKIMNLTLDKNG